MKIKYSVLKRGGQLTILSLSLLIVSSCMGEVKEKIKKAKQGVSNVTTIAEKAQEAKEDIENLKDATPLTNEELKKWLPGSIGDFERTGFKVGAAGYANVASVEGTYKLNDQDQKFNVSVIDGAGPAGSMIIAGLGMAAKMDMEQEDEIKHTKSVTVGDLRAQQTFHKKRNETALQFVVDNRFGVMVNGVEMNPGETWKLVEELNLNNLAQ